MLKNISKKTPDPKEDEKLTEEVIDDIMRRIAEESPETADKISRILAMRNALDDAMSGGMWSVYSEYGGTEPADEKEEPVVAPRPKKTKRKNIRKQGLHRPDDI